MNSVIDDATMFAWSPTSRGAHLPGCPYLRGPSIQRGDWKRAALALRRPCRRCAGDDFDRLADRFLDLLAAALARIPADLVSALPGDLDAQAIHMEAADARRRAFEAAGRRRAA